jgi:hypothetical protein
MLTKEQFQALRDKGLTTEQIIKFDSGIKPEMPVAPKEKLKTGLAGFGQTIGTAMASGGIKGDIKGQSNLQDMTNKLTLQISKMQKEGKDISRAVEQYKNITGQNFNQGVATTGNFNPANLYGETINKTNKQVIGEGISTLGATTLGSGAATVGGRLALGATTGGIYGAGSALEQNKSGLGVATDTLKGASIGLAVSGIFEGLGYALRKTASSRLIQNKTSNTYLKELQPKSSEIASQIERTPAGEAFKTIGTKIRDEVDDLGKPLYTGTYTGMMDKAKTTIANKGNQLENVLSQYDNVPTAKITKKEMSGTIIDDLADAMGNLTPAEKKVVEREISRVTADTITPSEALKYKRLYDSKIPDSFWEDTADRTKSIAVQSRYILRDNLRKLIDEKTADPIVQKLNSSMGLGMDVRRLTASQIATRAKMKVGGGGGVSPFKYVYTKLVDDFLLNPAVTTNASQKLKAMGSNTGQSTAGKLLRNTIIQQSSK